MVGLGGSLSDGDGLAQTVQQSFEVGHTLAQLGDLLLQGGEPLVKVLTLPANSALNPRRWSASSARMARWPVNINPAKAAPTATTAIRTLSNSTLIAVRHTHPREGGQAAEAFYESAVFRLSTPFCKARTVETKLSRAAFFCSARGTGRLTLSFSVPV